jgi:1,4-dihydroxy-6-naphthoate synthase
MFYALAKEKIPTGSYRFEHELVDIETLNRRAFHGELELTAVSVHAYAYLNDVYSLCNSGASMGDGYGPILVAREGDSKEHSKEQLAGKTIAIPGKRTTAALALQLWLSGVECDLRVVPFNRILDAVVAGEYEGTPIAAGVIIHEGQLTYRESRLEAVVDLGQWWQRENDGLPLPLGANAIRKDLGGKVIADVSRLLHDSILYGLEHREEALDYALQFGRGLAREQADRFVEMYVNKWTLDFGPRGREAVTRLLRKGHDAGLLPKRVIPDFV